MRVTSKSASHRTICGTSSGTGGRNTTRSPRRIGPYTRGNVPALGSLRCARHRLEPRGDVQLRIDRVDVVLDRLLLDAELGADLPIRATALHQRQDLQLTRCEPARVAGCPLRLGDDLRRERGRDDGPALGDGAERLRELIRAETAVHEISLGPGGDGVADMLGLVRPR